MWYFEARNLINNKDMKHVALALICMTLSLQALAWEDSFTCVENMRVGWNVGNSLDSNSGDVDNMWIEKWTSCTPTDYETAWGQPVTTPELIKMFADAGFGALRLPVTWYPHIDDNANVDADWMARVHEVVDYIIDAGLYCILNVHHDTGAETTAWLRASTDTYASVKTKYEALWTNIANEFKDYGEKLLFEAYNEMLDDYSSWCFASFGTSSGYDSSVATDAYTAINNYAQSFVNAVRATGGNNAERNLVVNTYGACSGEGSWNTHLTDPLSKLNYPDDSATQHIIFQIHTYPSLSTASSTMTSIKSCFDALKSNLVSKGGPVIIGEWGTSDNTTNYDSNRDEFVSFAKQFSAMAKEYGFAQFFWMMLSDGSDRSTPAWTTADLKDAILQGYYGDDYDPNAIKNVVANQTQSAVNQGIYNLQGVRLKDASQRGLYIIDGVKTIVK